MTTPEHTPALLLSLSGPLQSWGERSHFNRRDTARQPTRSGLLGLLSAALGRPRTDGIDDLARLSVTVRTDRPGTLLRDLHTVGGGLPKAETVTTAKGDKRDDPAATLLSERYYLADAAFTAALSAEADDADLIDSCARALRAPVWPPYLGRRACPPSGPLLLGRTHAPWHHLIHLPLARQGPSGEHNGGTGPDTRVTLHSDRPLDHLPPADENPAESGGDAIGEANDDPISFHPQQRRYRARPLYSRTLDRPGQQCAGLGTDYLTALETYLGDHAAPLGGLTP
ncbi:type I-E CRISPR-associated protein Cas5/CasD [Streptomonospora wellingtoniae]|uniref:Type I-E CRISPR-associated protein Cas5/CasD n=1 Tax=Streptomonospora wellingtoniae TaxID=3075544 RepID=A0ABU2KNI8_9ACTN|nr:type I-E CRISPR-associated protein Cas5/CasD [Streptomonospora sp. DSM 45055]MDT0300834.1 type I-E CRISPR-associated protein Cas5/CasD [Streptomonospora sp. DSM 45055]